MLLRCVRFGRNFLFGFFPFDFLLFFGNFGFLIFYEFGLLVWKDKFSPAQGSGLWNLMWWFFTDSWSINGVVISGVRYFDKIVDLFSGHSLPVIAIGFFLDIKVDIDMYVVVRSGDGGVPGSNAWVLEWLFFGCATNTSGIIIHSPDKVVNVMNLLN